MGSLTLQKCAPAASSCSMTCRRGYRAASRRAQDGGAQRDPSRVHGRDPRVPNQAAGHAGFALRAASSCAAYGTLETDFTIQQGVCKRPFAEVAELWTASQTGGVATGQGNGVRTTVTRSHVLSRSRGAFIAILVPVYRDLGSQTGLGTASGRRFSRSWLRDKSDALISGNLLPFTCDNTHYRA
jgi:hypothetical protein